MDNGEIESLAPRSGMIVNSRKLKQLGNLPGCFDLYPRANSNTIPFPETAVWSWFLRDEAVKE
jgi:hypothetical protein